MNKWIAEFDLEDGDTMPEHMELEYKGAKLDFYCKPKEPILDKIRAEIKHFMYDINPSSSESDYACNYILDVIDKYKEESEVKE